MGIPKTYDDWLALSDAEKDRQNLAWDDMAREGLGFAYTAGGRLAIASDVRVLDLHVGTYHGGEYVLHVYVSDEDFPLMPKSLVQTFEGFRVIWLPISQHFSVRSVD